MQIKSITREFLVSFILVLCLFLGVLLSVLVGMRYQIGNLEIRNSDKQETINETLKEVTRLENKRSQCIASLDSIVFDDETIQRTECKTLTENAVKEEQMRLNENYKLKQIEKRKVAIKNYYMNIIGEEIPVVKLEKFLSRECPEDNLPLETILNFADAIKKNEPTKTDDEIKKELASLNLYTKLSGCYLPVSENVSN